MRYRCLAIILLLAGLLHSYLWEMVDPKLSGLVWNLSGSALRLLLLLLIAISFQSAAMRLVCWLLIAGEMVTTACTAAYLIRPWLTVAGESCTARANLPLGVLGAVIGLALILSLVKKNDHDKRSS